MPAFFGTCGSDNRLLEVLIAWTQSHNKGTDSDLIASTCRDLWLKSQHALSWSIRDLRGWAEVDSPLAYALIVDDALASLASDITLGQIQDATLKKGLVTRVCLSQTPPPSPSFSLL